MAGVESSNQARQGASLLEAMFEKTSDAIFVVGEDGWVVRANPAALRMSGYTEEELIGQVPFCDICRGMATCSEEVSCVECFAKRMQVTSFEMRLRTKSGAEYPVAASSSHLSEGSHGDLVVILRDMSEQQRTERERYQRMITNYVIQAQEEERKRISRDLHDNIGQALYSVMVGLRVVNQLDLGEEVQNHLREVQKMAARTLEEVKTMSVELRPSTLDDLGLVPAIRSHIKRFSETFGMETELLVSGPKRRYLSIVETALYRICQEALTNAAKYADTDKIAIHLADRHDAVELTVQDAGTGFDLEQMRIQGTGLGLYGMRERAALIGGTFQLDSAPGQGTTVRVSIPIDEKGEPLYVHSHFDR